MSGNGLASELREAGLSPEAVRRVRRFLEKTDPIGMTRVVFRESPRQELRLRADRDRFAKALRDVCRGLETMLGTLALEPDRRVHASARNWWMRRHVCSWEEEQDFGAMLLRARRKLEKLGERATERRPRNEARHFVAVNAARALGHAGVPLDLGADGAWHRLTAWLLAQVEEPPARGFRLHRVLEGAAVELRAAGGANPPEFWPIIKVASRRH